MSFVSKPWLLQYAFPLSRVDTGDDSRVSKEEFCSDETKAAVNKWIKDPIEDFEAEFDKIDENKGGQILFKEFVKWAIEKNVDIEDDVDQDPAEPAPAEETAEEKAE